MDGVVNAAGQRKRVLGLSSATSSLGRRRQHWTHCEASPSLHPLHPPLPFRPEVNTAPFIHSPSPTLPLFLGILQSL